MKRRRTCSHLLQVIQSEFSFGYVYPFLFVHSVLRVFEMPNDVLDFPISFFTNRFYLLTCLKWAAICPALAEVIASMTQPCRIRQRQMRLPWRHSRQSLQLNTAVRIATCTTAATTLILLSEQDLPTTHQASATWRHGLRGGKQICQIQVSLHHSSSTGRTCLPSPVHR